MFKRNSIIGLILAMVLFIWCEAAIAETLQMGADFYLNDQYDLRAYHESHPLSDVPNNTGSQWVIGITVHNPAAQSRIGEARISADNVVDGMKYETLVTDPSSYPWASQTFDDYAIWVNNLAMVDLDGWKIEAFDTSGSQMEFLDSDGNTLGFSLMTAPPELDVPLPPICEIKHMAIKKNGDLKMIFTAPYDLRDSHIRVRIFTADGSGLDTELDRVYPPYQIIKKDGTIVPDKVRIEIPAEFVGRTGRLEYRVNNAMGQFRGITYFKLPELEVE